MKKIIVAVPLIMLFVLAAFIVKVNLEDSPSISVVEAAEPEGKEEEILLNEFEDRFFKIYNVLENSK